MILDAINFYYRIAARGDFDRIVELFVVTGLNGLLFALPVLHNSFAFEDLDVDFFLFVQDSNVAHVEDLDKPADTGRKNQRNALAALVQRCVYRVAGHRQGYGSDRIQFDATRRAQLDDRVTARSGLYDTPVGDRCTGLRFVAVYNDR